MPGFDCTMSLLDALWNNNMIKIHFVFGAFGQQASNTCVSMINVTILMNWFNCCLFRLEIFTQKYALQRKDNGQIILLLCAYWAQ